MRVFLSAALAASLALGASCKAHSPGSPMAGTKAETGPLHMPQVIVWAWQRPEDLSFIDPHETGISFLFETIRLEGGRVTAVPNQNQLKFPADAWLMACVRIETSGNLHLLSPLQAEEAATRIRPLAKMKGVNALQIDFDATVSERTFYREILTDVRRDLPPGFPISITALASWCMDDDWIAALPVNEAVPMLFRMGPDRESILRRLQQGGDFTEPLCRQSAGISTDEVVPRLPPGRHLYIFDPGGWTRSDFKAIMIRAKRE